MKKPIQLTFMMLALATTGISAQATPVTINNFSFETPTVSDGAFQTQSAGTTVSGTAFGIWNGWSWAKTVGSGFQDFGIDNQNHVAYTGADGSGTPLGANGINDCFLNQSINGGVTNIFQDVGILAANTTYTLTIAVGQRLDRVNGSAQIGLLDAASGATNVWATGTILASTTGVSSVAGSFQDFTVTFTTGSTVSGDLYVGARYTGDGKIQASIDNVRLDATAVPEPSTYAMLVGGLGMLLSFQRSRSRKA
jgi:hypothetical protein